MQASDLQFNKKRLWHGRFPVNFVQFGVSLLTKLQGFSLQLFKKEIPTEVFSGVVCEIFKNTYLAEYLPTTASVFSQRNSTKFYETEFSSEQKKRLNTISETKPNTVQLTINYFTVFAATKPKSEPAVVERLGLSDFAELAFADFV